MKSGVAKVLHRALDRQLLQHVLLSLKPLALDPVTVVTGHDAENVEAAYAGRGCRFVRQEPQLGTGHAVQVARQEVGEFADRPLLVISGDTPLLRHETIAALIEAHVSSDCAATLLTCRIAEPGAYGRIKRNASGGILKIIEARDASEEEKEIAEVNVGVYVFSVRELFSVLDLLGRANAQGEIYLTDVIGLLATAGRNVQSMAASDASETLGVNTLQDLAEATNRLLARKLDALMLEGVIVEDPDTTWVGSEAILETDAILRPFTIIEGRTLVRARARIGPFARLADAEIGEDAEILDHCLIRESFVQTGECVGPFVHLQHGRYVGMTANVGKPGRAERRREREASGVENNAQRSDHKERERR
ncbi:MAG: NTP transferase domain-containing protein [Vicinamibacteria bacterium]|nr:NTP transferase domain-containing protein [Vicinamibacteria bacterium]